MDDGNERTSFHASPINLFSKSSDRRLRSVSYYSWIIVTGHRKAHGMMQSALRQLLRSCFVCQLL